MRDTVRPGSGNEARIVEYAPMPPIRAIGATTSERSALVRWTTILVWFMRTMAVVWITKGLFAWTVVLGINRHRNQRYLGSQLLAEPIGH